MEHPIHGMRNAAWVGLHAAWIAAMPPRGIKHSICILLFNISLCYPLSQARALHIAVTEAGAPGRQQCLLSVGADLSPFINDRMWDYNFITLKWIFHYNELLCDIRKDSASFSDKNDTRDSICVAITILSKSKIRDTFYKRCFFNYFKYKIFFRNIFKLLL